MSVATPDAPSAEEIVQFISDVDYQVPDVYTKIFKDECMYCFHTPYFEGGLFVCLKTFTSFCARHLKEYAERTGSVAFVQVLSKKVPIARDDEPEQKISRLAVGVEGGFCNEKFDIVDDYFLVTYPNVTSRLPINEEKLGNSQLFQACNKVVTTTSAERLEMLQNASNAWDGEVKQVTKHANLEQLPGRSVASSGWECEAEGCDLAENLWLNLVDGAVRCGRSQFISEGQKSKGNNHMKQYFDATGYALVVKLGTIEKDGTADVYSYDEDEAVIDPNLRKHLAHLGLDLDKLEKTEKSTIELEMDMNQKWEWSLIQEDGANLENAYGPGNSGLINIGSSCYMNSVLQAFCMIPEFCARFSGEKAATTLAAMPPADVFKDFNGQVTRLVKAMLSGDYAVPDGEHNGIKPTQFKRIVGAGNAEFSTAKQQDAEEYVRYFVEKVTSMTPAGEIDPSVALKFKTEVRFEDVASGRVRYTDREEVVMALPVPKEAMKPLANEEGRFSVKFEECLDAYFAAHHIDGFKSPITGETKGATNISRMKTFPDFLFVQMQKFTVDESYNAKKLDVDIEVSDDLDLSVFRGRGQQPGEELLPEDAPSGAQVVPPGPDFDESVVNQLVDMGFSRNAAIRASIETKTQGGAEAAAEWVMMRLDDPSINDPYIRVVQSAEVGGAIAPQDDPHVDMLVGFGFSKHQASYALRRHNRDTNMAAEWLFTHADEVPPEHMEGTGVEREGAEKREAEMRDGPGQYRLVGFISHMGSSPHSGHYVAHLYKDGKWVLYNDEKVAISQNPPKQLAYLYLFQRV